MKSFPPRLAAQRATSPAIPAFYPVPVRCRRDGWTPLRQAEFIGQLAETRSVSMAVQRVGMARETAYRLRKRPWAESFCAAWDAALGERSQISVIFQQKVTVDQLRWCIDAGLWRVRIIAGHYAGVQRKADNSALIKLLAQLDRGGRRHPARGRGG